MKQLTIADRVRAVQRVDRGEGTPESLIAMAVVAALAAAVVWLFFDDRFGATWWMAIPLAALDRLFAGGYVVIKALDALDAARWRRAHETGE